MIPTNSQHKKNEKFWSCFWKYVAILIALILVVHLNNGRVLGISVVSSLLKQYNEELRVYNHLGAELAWNISIDLENGLNSLQKNEELLVAKNLWNNEWCMKLLAAGEMEAKVTATNLPFLGSSSQIWSSFASNSDYTSLEDQRQIYLICRGPRFSSYQVSNFLAILGQLRTVYDTSKVCIDGEPECYRMEPELNHFMESNRNEPKLKEAWSKWHSVVGQQLSKPYFDLVKLMNVGARQAGHANIGSCWREEMETENLIEKSLALYKDVKYLYSLLHSFVRFKLAKYYRLDLKGKPIPAHLLGNMWSQRWDSLMDIIAPEEEHNTDDDENTRSAYIKEHIGSDATVDDMVHFAEQYYIDMGFPSLPATFYEHSYFKSDPNSTSKNCHGSAANMFNGDDYRIMMCASVQDSDLSTLIHEMGHIHYFMAYATQPTIFQDGANSGFHEALGDSITYGLYPKPNLRSLLKLGLAKLPQIGFGLIVDLWRWEIFENENNFQSWNDLWWQLQYEFMGISKPEGYISTGLDALGKYHIVDNIPYIRYFYASFLQHMFYHSLCPVGQNYCSLEGRGEKLRKMMSEGSSKHWSVVLKELTGQSQVTSTSLLNYFRPLQRYLEAQMNELGLDIGW